MEEDEVVRKGIQTEHMMNKSIYENKIYHVNFTSIYSESRKHTLVHDTCV